jgi:aqualysin 1
MSMSMQRPKFAAEQKRTSVNPLSRRILATLAATPVLLAGVVGAGLGGAAAAGPTGSVLPAVAADPDPESGLAPLLGLGQRDLIANRYIVVLRDSASNAQLTSAETAVKDAGGRIHHRYGSALRGFAANLSTNALADLRADPDVAFVEADRRISVAAVQRPATWALDRIDQRSRTRNGAYFYTSTGTGVTAYVIDSGIRLSHNDFEGRAVFGFDAYNGGGTDCNGHGTHVAGSLGGKTYGVAKKVSLVSVRVLDCEGFGEVSDVLEGVDWVTAHHQAGTPAVANMSIGGPPSSAIDQAVNRSIGDGVTYAVAAGNESTSACGSSPARVGAAITVGSTQSNDRRSSFSNIGSCLDLFAPGTSVTSTWASSNTATAVASGTSMASPHVAGAAALYLQLHPNASPATVRNELVNRSTKGTVVSPGTNSPNRLLYSRDL